jgi:hypothetical protein
MNPDGEKLVEAGGPSADSAQTIAGFRWDNHITPVG